MSHNPNPPSSIKIIAAQRRMQTEKDFLKSLCIQHDDPDAVLGDDGKPLTIRQVLSVEGVGFALNSQPISRFRVQEAFDVIASCARVIQRLRG